MATKPSAGDLYESVSFEKREVGNPDSPADYGNTETTWRCQYSCRAAYQHLRGGETVLAGRLQGRHPQIIRVRASSETREVTTDWRIVDSRSGSVFNIRDVTPTLDRRFIEFLVESGVAT